MPAWPERIPLVSRCFHGTTGKPAQFPLQHTSMLPWVPPHPARSPAIGSTLTNWCIPDEGHLF